jgi:hypothetical protein
MKFFPLTVVDDFFPDVDYVLDLAKNAKYQEKKGENYPGVTSEPLIDSHPELCEWTQGRIFSLFWDTKTCPIDMSFSLSVDFNKIEPQEDPDHLLNKGLIHYDDSLAACIIYLSETPKEDTGTSIYRLKREHQYYTGNNAAFVDQIKATRKLHSGKKVADLEEKIEKHRSKYEEVMRMQAAQNRMVLYSGDSWHSPTTYGKEIRYTMRIFINTLLVEACPQTGEREGGTYDVTYPLLREFR